MERTVSRERVAELLHLLTVARLRDLIATEREQGRAFGQTAEACRDELAKRCERE